MPHVKSEYNCSSLIGNSLSFIWRRYSKKAVIKAKMYISPYQRKGSPGIISGLSQEGKSIDSSIVYII
jgi:hypothetical protein